MLKRDAVLMPAIDLLDGSVVRLHQGSYDKVTHFGDDPLAVAQRFAADGAEWLHVIDLSAARDGVRPAVHRRLIERLAGMHELSSSSAAESARPPTWSGRWRSAPDGC